MGAKERQVVVVTGGSAGVGPAVVRAFTKQGADIGLTARGEDGLSGASREVLNRGRRVVAVTADVADAVAVEAAADRIERGLGPIDTWVNNAMVSVFSPVKELRAIQGFTESLRCELLHDKSGVHVAMVQLPAMNTPQFAVPPMYRADNLWHPLPGDHGAHGRFGNRSWSSSQQMWINERLAFLTATVSAGLAFWTARRRFRATADVSSR